MRAVMTRRPFIPTSQAIMIIGEVKNLEVFNPCGVGGCDDQRTIYPYISSYQDHRGSKLLRGI
ncbi:hypothetical protein [Aquiflexum sp.]|uniref:hypothetical protein n=1 Tax=Aquiflexum sp. TaxID=1872584 RepID=UPI003594717F